VTKEDVTMKAFGEKLLGIFIEEETDAPAAPAAPPAPKKTEPRPAPPSGSGTDRDRLAKVMRLLESLPPNAAPDMKRAIVAASLEAFGISIDGIVGAARGALDGLDAQVAEGHAKSDAVRSEAERQIARLAAEIDEIRKRVAETANAQQELARRAASERARVHVVIDFFEGGHVRHDVA
jgi:hypothetical protein